MVCYNNKPCGLLTKEDKKFVAMHRYESGMEME